MSVAESVRRLKLIADAAVPDGWTTYVGSPAASGDLPDRYLAVCYGGDDRPGVVGQAVWNRTPQNDSTGDTWFVWCTASCASGDIDPVARLDEVEDIYDAFASILIDSRTLPDVNGDPLLVAGGMATLSTHEWTVEDDGTIATVFWQVQVDVRW